MSTENIRKTYMATVRSKAEAEDGYKIEMDIPAFKSDYPTLVTRVDSDLARRLAVGQTYSLILEQQNLKKGKTGSRLYDYYYGLVGIADTQPTEPQVQPPYRNGDIDARGADTAREQATNRRTALMQAVAMAQGREFGSKEVLQVAQAFSEWLDQPYNEPF